MFPCLRWPFTAVLNVSSNQVLRLKTDSFKYYLNFISKNSWMVNGNPWNRNLEWLIETNPSSSTSTHKIIFFTMYKDVCHKDYGCYCYFYDCGRSENKGFIAKNCFIFINVLTTASALNLSSFYKLIWYPCITLGSILTWSFHRNILQFQVPLAH